VADRLGYDFYARPAPEVAVDLIGCCLVRQEGSQTLRGRIVETEAYLGRDDPGSHAFRGPSARTQVMFGPAGRLYVYFTYGMHFCVNVVTDSEGTAGAVLLRALQPLDGLEVMRERRGGRPDVELCNGPAKLCQAFGIDREQNGMSLLDGPFRVEPRHGPPLSIRTSRRVGLSAGREFELRYFESASPFVSPGKPST
jgi:DNA-3-methyladenine glycosylase